jgi:RNA polymerase primary sigma factor
MAARESTVRRIVSRLNERERKVIEMRFGLRDQLSWSRPEIGRALDLTSERIRQIEKLTLKKLETLARSGGLQDIG